MEIRNNQDSGFLPLPEPYHTVVVICGEFSCPGFRDSSGTWRRFIDKKPLNDVRGWLEMDEPAKE
jgi:hypothetical protein